MRKENALNSEDQTQWLRPVHRRCFFQEGNKQPAAGLRNSLPKAHRSGCRRDKIKSRLGVKVSSCRAI